MSYGRFAEVYDQLMKDMPYDQWTRFLLEKQNEFNITGRRLMDVGCGTGEWTLKIAQEGFEVTGIDLSDSMLAVASNKAQEAGVAIEFFQQDMAEASGFEAFDIITIFCDSLNYLETEDEVKSTFHHMHKLLNPGGLFLFDIHSIYKMDTLFIDQSFTYDDGEVAYIWNSFSGDHPYSVEHELSFFVLEDEERDSYIRFDELHKQRTYTIQTYKALLEETGFTVEGITADFSPSLSPSDESERIFFTCRK
ncbi:class I SAM-dependent methyltransferase [Jeotgalibacillus sp. S-D1]|uniref:class I SAM-dependent DNA methyltransferase n=1 Tax=Jeotgalibacillus sp. S-D1 TaxID=2552189 RepID=UPI0010593D0B|nr:class I SAM-dependent methyltransferase [Jeotgalibacillus sp. S-D1]TDL34479.1 class I SAM-dependent methyltransferase [Jeotgalibacillus sp. S-D1]